AHDQSAPPDCAFFSNTRPHVYNLYVSVYENGKKKHLHIVAVYFVRQEPRPRGRKRPVRHSAKAEDIDTSDYTRPEYYKRSRIYTSASCAALSHKKLSFYLHPLQAPYAGYRSTGSSGQKRYYKMHSYVYPEQSVMTNQFSS